MAGVGSDYGPVSLSVAPEAMSPYVRQRRLPGRRDERESMSDSLFEAIDADDFLPGAHNPTALVHNPFEWTESEDDRDAETNG